MMAIVSYFRKYETIAKSMLARGLHIKQEVDDVAILHDVLFTFHTHSAQRPLHE